MADRHNPIARIIEKLQLRWLETTEKCPDYKLIRWLIKPEEIAMINGFYRLEASRYGSLPEFFVVMLTPFEKSGTDFSRQLIADWTAMWNEDTAVKQSAVEWHPETWMKKAEKSSHPEQILGEMLVDFQKQVCRKDQVFVFGLLPRSVSDFYAYNYWIDDVAKKLPPVVKLSFMDYLDGNYLKESFKDFKEKALSIECGDLNVQQAIRRMATAGDQNDPSVGFRKCLFEMADGVASKNVGKIHQWGKQALLLAQTSGLKSFFATAYLVYAGFLLQLRKDECDELLDKGISIAENAVKTGDTESVGILLQLYGYKAAYQSIKRNKTKASRWLSKQAHFALENGQNAYSISIFRMAAKMAKSAWEDALYYECLETGYHAGDELTEEELRSSEISILAYHYAKELQNEKK